MIPFLSRFRKDPGRDRLKRAFRKDETGEDRSIRDLFFLAAGDRGQIEEDRKTAESFGRLFQRRRRRLPGMIEKRRGGMRIFSWDIFSRNRDRVYGLAIMMVMAYHYLEDVAEAAAGQVPGWLGGLAGFNHYFIAQSSLEWFVFLSGMGLYFSMEKDPSARRFWRRRLGRVLVPYLLVGVPYWLYRDLIFHFRGPAAFFKDLFFICSPFISYR